MPLLSVTRSAVEGFEQGIVHYELPSAVRIVEGERNFLCGVIVRGALQNQFERLKIGALGDLGQIVVVIVIDLA